MPETMPTPAEIAAGYKILMILADAIKELGSVPNGHFYARVCDLVSFENYTAAIMLLKDAKVIKEENNVLIWIGPTERTE